MDGGETKIENLVLLCRRDHTDLHHGHWTITITNGQVHVTRPTWADPPPRPHRPADEVSQAREPEGRPRPLDPTDDASRGHKPPGDRPTRPDPADASRAHESLDGQPTRSGPSDGGLTSTGTPRAQTSTPADDPWGGTDLPAASAPTVGPSRWHADEQTRAEAARFAVWGDEPPEYSSVRNRATNDTGTGPPSFATI
ncbi:hypothetical protein [Kribbella sindirgiensis]|uniref:hypothetical protein n=1 Tax=Kribbella sindirgiensis TaxID=1124744 RepID=UPI001EE0DD17|nr:hypothetical protein [Kribbella sindirgiensis]